MKNNLASRADCQGEAEDRVRFGGHHPGREGWSQPRSYYNRINASSLSTQLGWRSDANNEFSQLHLFETSSKCAATNQQSLSCNV